MQRHRRSASSRRGAVAVLAAVMMVFLLGMVAFAVDMGYLTRVSGELQNAADAAALAGASQLVIPQMAGLSNQNKVATNAVSNATSELQKFALLNKAGGVNLAVLSTDIQVGHLTNPTDINEALVPWSSGGAVPNTVQVILRRDSSANAPVALFFARVIGTNSWSGSAAATASIMQSSNVAGFKGVTGGPNGLLLPVAVDYTMWSNFMTTGKSADGLVHDDYTAVRSSSAYPAPANVTLQSDGIPEFTDVYPDNTSPGNFGLIDIGPPSTNTPTFSSWVLYGPTPSDLQFFGSSGLQASAASPATMTAGPGLKSPLQTDFAAIVGQGRVAPLFSNYSGTGSNATYSVVGFAGLTVVNAVNRGTNMQITVQPMVVIDPTAVTGSGASGNTTSGVYASSPLELVR